MRKRPFTIALVILVVGAAVVWWRVAQSRAKEVTYRTDTVQQGDVRVQVSATGTLQAVTTVQVGSQVSGTISALYADFNDHVKKEQLLAELDPTFLRAQVAQSRADLNNAQVQVRQAERDSMRTFPLADQGLVSKADLDAARTKLDAARAGAASSEAALDRAETNLRYASIYSPIDGVVISRNVDVGQTVAASLSAPTLFTIAADLTQMQLEADVDEADIGQIREGETVTFTVDAYPNRTYHGVVHQIRLSPTTVQNVVTYSVIVYVQNPDQTLLPGMTANVTFLVDEARNVLKVPNMALRFRPPGATAPGPGRHAYGQGGPAAGGVGGAAGGTGGAAVAGGVAGGPTAGGGPANDAGGTGGRGAGRRHEGGAGGQFAAGGIGGSHGFAGDAPEAGGAPGSRHAPGMLYILENGDKLHPVRVRTGETDGTFTAVYSDSLHEGMRVVLSAETAGKGDQEQQQVVNPFAPRRPGGRH